MSVAPDWPHLQLSNDGITERSNCQKYTVSVCLSVYGGYAAAKREVKKITKYNSELHDGSKPHMIPLVFEHFGHWGSEGEKFLHYIAKLSRNDQ